MEELAQKAEIPSRLTDRVKALDAALHRLDRITDELENHLTLFTFARVDDDRKPEAELAEVLPPHLDFLRSTTRHFDLIAARLESLRDRLATT